ncbi:unnamed protein product [marine sediment metagenome]|uniref:Uncharacterized protein n=1 Tax=marine sediment metagenome TaxID=412755 RepID=X0TWI3_9ZZZZ
MITKALLDEWKRQAEKDGNLDEYEYHLGMVREPFPYRQWKRKKATLDKIQARDDYDDLSHDNPVIVFETQLCQELGY